ncbi:MAG: outer membrane beta-barrel protein [Flavisolibacter sp.]
MKQTSIIFLFLLMATASMAQVRQRSNTKGFNAAVNVHSLGWTSEYFQYLDENAGNGLGGGVRFGYGVTQLIEPYVGFDFTSMNISNVDAQGFKMTHIDFGVRFNLGGTISPFRPFVEGGYSARKGKITQVVNGMSYVDAEFSGGTPHVGGGINYFASRAIAIFARGLFTVGKKSNLSIDGSTQTEKADVTTFRIGLGVNVNLSELISNQ